MGAVAVHQRAVCSIRCATERHAIGGEMLKTRTALGTLFLAASVSSSCADTAKPAPRTAIIVEVGSDLDVPGELDEIRVYAGTSASESDAGSQSARGSLRRRSDLPVKVVLEPAAGVTTVYVIAEGYLDDELVRRQSRRPTFVPNRVRELSLFLAKACTQTCPEGETCVSDESGTRCESEVIDLDPGDGGGDGDGDGDGDAGDSGADERDAGPVDAGRVDGGDAGGCVASDEVCNGLDDDCDDRIDDGDTICPQGMPFAIASCGTTGGGDKACVTECVGGYLDCAGDGPGCGTEVSADNCGCEVQCGGDDPCAPSLTEPGQYECLSAGCTGEGEQPCDGFCVNTQVSPSNCGECDNPCSQLPNAIPTCEDGECKLVCAPGYRSCDGDEPGSEGYDNGCEIDINTDITHCGACEGPTAVCPERDNAETICDDGVCGMRCESGFLNCDERVSTGCETPSDRDNCYQCGNECSDGIVGVLPEQCCAGPRDCCTL